MLLLLLIAPKLPENALPDSKDAIEGATVPSAQFGVPLGSKPPFWIMLKKSPYVFPTMSPWFYIPGRKELLWQVW